MNKKEFPLSQEPVDRIVTVHMGNLFETYGEDEVRKALTELFSIELPSDKDIEEYLEKSSL